MPIGDVRIAEDRIGGGVLHLALSSPWAVEVVLRMPRGHPPAAPYRNLPPEGEPFFLPGWHPGPTLRVIGGQCELSAPPRRALPTTGPPTVVVSPHVTDLHRPCGVAHERPHYRRAERPPHRRA
eukprot:gene27254-36867_t